MTKEQIASLYQFTSKHFVEHYDLQTELVDHLANGITSIWEKNPNISFEEALKSEFKKFGIFGFHDVIEKRRRAMNKRYFRIIGNFYKTYFRLPRILITLVFVLGYYTVIHALPPGWQYYFFSTTFLVAFLFLMFKAFKFRNAQKAKAKRWLLEELIFNQIAFINIALIPIQVLSFSDSLEITHPGIQIFVSALAILYLLLIYVVTTVIPAQAQELLKKNYPEYEMV